MNAAPGTLTVTIIIPVRNDHRIVRALESVLSQELPANTGLQVVVVDDSDDGTSDILSGYGNCVDITSTPGGARGVYAARNHGLSLARGDIVNFIGADDVYADGRVVMDAVGAFMECPSLDLVYGWVSMVNAEGEIVYVPPRKAAWRLLLAAHMIPDPASYWNRDAFRRFGGYREDLVIAGDYEYFLRAVVRGRAYCVNVNRTFTMTEIGGISSSPSLEMDLFIAWERLSAWKSNWSWPMLISEMNFMKMITAGNTRRVLARLGAGKVKRMLRRILCEGPRQR